MIPWPLIQHHWCYLSILPLSPSILASLYPPQLGFPSSFFPLPPSYHLHPVIPLSVPTPWFLFTFLASVAVAGYRRTSAYLELETRMGEKTYWLPFLSLAL